ncbi:MAG: TetR family transcriptional regulator [Candidatus Eisenbacteria bacterium]|nr:TetR family transcriptional regulator [Candidatus Eisenbacteria bacterium]
MSPRATRWSMRGALGPRGRSGRCIPGAPAVARSRNLLPSPSRRTVPRLDRSLSPLYFVGQTDRSVSLEDVCRNSLWSMELSMSRSTMKKASGSARARILDAAANVLAQRGYDAANVDEIVRRSGASKGAFYFHFPSKEEMVAGLVQQLSDRLIEKVRRAIANEPPSRRRLALAVRTLLETFARKRSLGRLLLINMVGHSRAVDRKFWPVREAFASFIADELAAARDAGELPAAIDIELAARVWLGALHESLLHWLMSDRPGGLVEQSDGLSRLLIYGVAGPEVETPSDPDSS